MLSRIVHWPKIISVVSMSLLALCSACDEDHQETEQMMVRSEGSLGKIDGFDTQGDQPLRCSETPQGWNPNGVHQQRGTPQFEGWYYRVTEPNRDESWVIIVAFWRDKQNDERAFIELLRGSTGDTYKRVFENIDIKSLQEDEGEFELEVGSMRFSADRISGVLIDDQGHSIELNLNIDACAYWGAPEDERNRWTMGWVTELPGPPLKWHVHHLKGEANGSIIINYGEVTEAIEIEQAPLHQEKNWGGAFPKRWVWLQSNHFEGRPDVAFAAAGGPVFGFDLSPSGYMLGLRWRNQFLNWRTQDGHRFPEVDFKIDTASGVARWTMVAEGLKYRAKVLAEAPISELIPVDVPGEGGLSLGAFEHLSANVTVEIFQRRGLSWESIDVLTSSRTAVEAGGEFAAQLGL